MSNAAKSFDILASLSVLHNYFGLTRLFSVLHLTKFLDILLLSVYIIIFVVSIFLRMRLVLLRFIKLGSRIGRQYGKRSLL